MLRALRTFCTSRAVSVHFLASPKLQTRGCIWSVSLYTIFYVSVPWGEKYQLPGPVDFVFAPLLHRATRPVQLRGQIFNFPLKKFHFFAFFEKKIAENRFTIYDFISGPPCREKRKKPFGSLFLYRKSDKSGPPAVTRSSRWRRRVESYFEIITHCLDSHAPSVFLFSRGLSGFRVSLRAGASKSATFQSAPRP